MGKEGRDVFGEFGADVVAGDLEDVFAIEFATLGAEGVDDFEGQAGADVTGDEGGFEFVPIEVGFAESGEEGFEEAGHSDWGLRNAECGLGIAECGFLRGSGVGRQRRRGFGAEFLGDLVEDAVDEGSGFGAAEHFGDFDGFV